MSKVNNWRKFCAWWRMEGGDVLELQPLREPPESSTLERILGLDEPFQILSRQAESRVAWFDWLFPPELPVDVQLIRLENLAIPMCYFTVGVCQGMMRPILNVYPLDLGATEAQQTVLALIATLPSTFKVLYGFTSDNFSIFGYRRKPYMFIGWLLVSSAMATLLYTSDLSLQYDYQNNPAHSSTSKKEIPSMQWLMILFFITGCGMWLADVMADSLVAQKVPMEPASSHGNMQAACYSSRFFGLMMAAPISSALYSYCNGPVLVVWILFLVPFPLYPLMLALREERNAPIVATADQCREIWSTVCSRAVWQPMGFIYLFNILQIPNAAWRQYLKTVLGFTAGELNTLLVVSYVLLFLGTLCYKQFFLHSSWRRLYQVCILFTGIISVSQLALIKGYTWRLSPFMFALGDDALAEFLLGIQFLPVAILMVSLCPVGSEGASYAMFTTVWNSAMMLAPAIGSSVLLGIWDVSKEALEAGELDGLFKLSMLTTLIQMSPLLFINWLPRDRGDLQILASCNKSSLGGGIFLLVLFASVIYTFAVTLLNIFAPGWFGNS